MDTHIILIVLAAAFFHAVWNASVKSGGDKMLSLVGMQIAISAVALLLVPLVGLPHADSWPYLLASMGFHFGYYLSLANAYRYGDFAQSYPVARGTAPIWVALYGVLVLRESLGGIEWLSLAGVLGGIMIFASRRLGAVLHHRTGLLHALATSCFIGAYTISDGVGGRLSLNVSAYIVWLSFLNGVPLTLYALHRRSWREVAALAGGWRIHLLAGVLSLAAYWMVVWAMSQAPIALVSALRETSVIIAALIGAYYFKEPAGRRRIVASVVIFVSIALLGWG